MTSPDERLSYLQERIAKLESSTSSAHNRIDELKLDVKENLRSLAMKIEQFIEKAVDKDDVAILANDVKELTTFINKGKGYLGAMLLIGGVASYIVQTIVTAIFFK